MRILVSLALVLATVAGFCQGKPFRERIRLFELSEARIMQFSNKPAPKVTYGNRMLEAASAAMLSDHLLSLAGQPRFEEQLRQMEESASGLFHLLFEYRYELESLRYDWEASYKDLRTGWTRIICVFPDENDFLAELAFGKSDGYEAKLMTRAAREKIKAYNLMLPSAKENYDKFRSYLNLVHFLEK